MASLSSQQVNGNSSLDGLEISEGRRQENRYAVREHVKQEKQMKPGVVAHILAFQRLRQEEGLELETSLGYLVRHCLRRDGVGGSEYAPECGE